MWLWLKAPSKRIEQNSTYLFHGTSFLILVLYACKRTEQQPFFFSKENCNYFESWTFEKSNSHGEKRNKNNREKNFEKVQNEIQNLQQFTFVLANFRNQTKQEHRPDFLDEKSKNFRKIHEKSNNLMLTM